MSDLAERIQAVEHRIVRLESTDRAAGREIALLRDELRRLEGRVWILATTAAGAGAAGAGVVSHFLGAS